MAHLTWTRQNNKVVDIEKMNHLSFFQAIAAPDPSISFCTASIPVHFASSAKVFVNGFIPAADSLKHF